jgi:hypothetical protein
MGGSAMIFATCSKLCYLEIEEEGERLLITVIPFRMCGKARRVYRA